MKIQSNIKHIYWFAHYHLDCPSTRYRGQLPLQYLAKNMGIEYDFIYPDRSANGLWKFFRVFFAALLFRKPNSLIVIQKICSNGWYAKALKLLISLRPKNTLYDIDDAEYLRQNSASLHFFLRNCEKVSVGSDALKEYCTPFNPNVFVLTSPVKNHTIRKTKRNKKIHIGWVGDFGNGKEISKAFSHKTSMFKLFFPELQKIQQPVKLSLIGVKNKTDIPEILNYFEQTPNVELVIPTHLDWQSDDWLYPEISKFDIGISPMVNHPFNRSKSAFKAKQYLSAGVPVLASDVGENNKFVKHRQNGFLCKEKGDFLSAIQQIIEMSDEKYFKMRDNALINREFYSIERYCKELLKIRQRDTK
ncbi:MAG: glycosyltransferase [Chitinophagales bacterium]